MAAVLLGRFHCRGSTPSNFPLRPILIGVEGEVGKPGVHVFEDSEVTVGGAIEAAGGLRGSGGHLIFTEVAARRIRTGQRVRVAASDQDSVTVAVEAMPAATRLTLGEKLDINSSSVEELLLVPQMKAAFAEAIVKRHPGPGWQSLDELEVIPGVGPRTVDKWRSYLEVINSGMGGVDEEGR